MQATVVCSGFEFLLVNLLETDALVQQPGVKHKEYSIDDEEMLYLLCIKSEVWWGRVASGRPSSIISCHCGDPEHRTAEIFTFYF